MVYTSIMAKKELTAIQQQHRDILRYLIEYSMDVGFHYIGFDLLARESKGKYTAAEIMNAADYWNDHGYVGVLRGREGAVCVSQDSFMLQGAMFRAGL
jgi:hypothetical protein